MLREILTRFTAGKVFKRSMPKRVGGQQIFVSPGASLGYLKRNMDDIAGMKELFDAADMFISSGNVVWDIGANLGVFSFAAAYKAGKAGRVLALEPDVFLVDIIHRSIALQDHDKHALVEVIPAAVSDSSGLIGLNIASRGRAANYIETAQGSTQVGQIVRKNWVCQLTLDSLLEKFHGPHFIKIDVEGAELAVLNGGSKILAEYQPLILCEVRGNLSRPVSDLLHSNGYILYNSDDLSAGKINTAVYNTLAVPNAAVARIEEIIKVNFRDL